jgi:hypothetical protein
MTEPGKQSELLGNEDSIIKSSRHRDKIDAYLLLGFAALSQCLVPPALHLAVGKTRGFRELTLPPGGSYHFISVYPYAITFSHHNVPPFANPVGFRSIPVITSHTCVVQLEISPPIVKTPPTAFVTARGGNRAIHFTACAFDLNPEREREVFRIVLFLERVRDHEPFVFPGEIAVTVNRPVEASRG